MVSFTLNDDAVLVDLPDGTPLIHVLRDHLGLFGTRLGCAAEQCGSCMVLVDGRPMYSCSLGLDAVANRQVRTVEGLGSPDHPHPLQSAFLAEQAGQCGFCLSGILVSAAALLEAVPDPDEAQIRAALDRHLCRCGAHNRIMRAISRAAAAGREAAGA